MMMPGLLAAQFGKVQDVIYLKDGTILRGQILDESNEETLKIQITGYNVIVVERDEIDKITQEKRPRAEYYNKEGYINTTSLVLSPGERGSSARFGMVNGYQVDPNFSIGLGLGYSSYNDAPLSAIPVFVDLKYKILKANRTPFVFVKAGYNFSVNEKTSGNQNNDGLNLKEQISGTMLNTGIGLHFDVAKNLALNFTFGYLADNLSYTEMFGFREIETKLKYRRAVIGFGLSF